MSQKKQSSISAFFASSRPAPQPKPPVHTPQKTRPKSVLVSAASDGFDEIHSSDTSFGSPEALNFTSGLADKGAPDTQGKRTHALFLDHMNGGPRKMQRPRTAAPVTFTATPLNDEQMSVVTLAKSGRSIFYTGSAGTGKSVVLRELVRQLTRLHGGSRVGVTASTGLAACNIGGQTLHRFLGIGLGAGSPSELSNRIKKNPSTLKRWKGLRVLIIDEISMIDGVLFAKLDEIAKVVRKNPQPFGGIQLICSGDFFQLPPVSKDNRAQFCFESPSWKKCIGATILLTQVYRQQNDSELVDMLNALRYGDMSPAMVAKFRALERLVKYTDGIEPTELYPTRDEVKRANQKRLDNLRARPRRFVAKDNTTNPVYVKMLENLMCEQELVLKPGAQVMYLKNFDDKIVNGTIGKVLFFCTSNLWLRIQEDYGGAAFVDDPALEQEVNLVVSRVGTSRPWTDAEQTAYSQVPPSRLHKFDSLCKLASSEPIDDLYPVVDFKVSENENVLLRVCKEPFSISLGSTGVTEDGDESITREQLPLLLSWAMSIHKAQGQTIKRLSIDLRKVFEKGQVYVALSRATDKDNLEVRNFDPRRITVSETVKEFYRNMKPVS